MKNTGQLAFPSLRIWSIGYGGKNLANFIDLLKTNRITLVADVRRSPGKHQGESMLPWAANPDFRGESLCTKLHDAGISYRHWAVCGNPFKSTSSSIPKSSILRDYANYLADRPHIAEKIVAKLRANPQQRVALLCLESARGACHRGVILRAMKKIESSLIIVDI